MSQPTEPADPLPGSPRGLRSLGEVGDFSSFYQATIVPLRSYLARVLGDRAEAQDIAQDAFLRTYEAMAGQPVEKPRSFLFVTARRLALNFRSRRSRRMIPSEDTFLDAHAGSISDPAEALIARQRADALDAAVLALPPVCQQVLLLRLKENLSHAEIAEKLSIAPSTVAKHLSRAFRQLRSPGNTPR